MQHLRIVNIDQDLSYGNLLLLDFNLEYLIVRIGKFWENKQVPPLPGELPVFLVIQCIFRKHLHFLGDMCRYGVLIYDTEADGFNIIGQTRLVL